MVDNPPDVGSYEKGTFSYHLAEGLKNKYKELEFTTEQRDVVLTLLSGIKNSVWNEIRYSFSENGSIPDNVPFERALAVTLISLAFNFGDDLVEEELMQNSQREGDSREDPLKGGENLLSKRIPKCTITFDDMFSLISQVLERGEINVDRREFNRWLNSILQANVKALKKAANWEGYSIDDALNFRKDTLGEYFSFLQKVAQSNYQGIPERLFYIQFADDFEDIGQDLLTQMNPFIALIYKHGLNKSRLIGKDFSMRGFSSRLRLSWARSAGIHTGFPEPKMRYRDNVAILKEVNWRELLTVEHSSVNFIYDLVCYVAVYGIEKARDELTLPKELDIDLLIKDFLRIRKFYIEERLGLRELEH